MSLEETDKAAAAVAKAPRVTLNGIKDKIAARHFTTAYDALQGGVRDEHVPKLRCLTLCFLVMSNSFVVVGKSAPANPENYNQELGEKVAFEDAMQQIWLLEGYLLWTRLQESQDKQPG